MYDRGVEGDAQSLMVCLRKGELLSEIVRRRAFATRTFAVLALLVVRNAAARTPHAVGRTNPQPPVSLVASYEYVSGKSGQAEVLLIDTRGREFALEHPPGSLFGSYIAGGVLSSSDTTRLVTVARPVSGRIPPAEVEHAGALVAAADRSTVWTHRPRMNCKDGAGIRIHGYVFPPESARVTQKVVLLYRSYCQRVMEENLSPDADELIGWISRRWREYKFAEQCAVAAALKLSNPKVVAGTVAAGQSATIQLMLTNTSGKGYLWAPQATLSSFTSGVTISDPIARMGEIYPDQRHPLRWTAVFSASLHRGIEVRFSAVVHSAGGSLVCPTDDISTFSFVTQ
jgi:hypothetical protein